MKLTLLDVVVVADDGAAAAMMFGGGGGCGDVVNVDDGVVALNGVTMLMMSLSMRMMTNFYYYSHQSYHDYNLLQLKEEIQFDYSLSGCMMLMRRMMVLL